MQTDNTVSLSQVFTPVLHKIDHWLYVRRLRSELRTLGNAIPHEQQEIKDKHANLLNMQTRHLHVKAMLRDAGVNE
jgi:hypothetical protein